MGEDGAEVGKRLVEVDVAVEARPKSIGFNDSVGKRLYASRFA